MKRLLGGKKEKERIEREQAQLRQQMEQQAWERKRREHERQQEILRLEEEKEAARKAREYLIQKQQEELQHRRATERKERMRTAEPETLRNLRELIRRKYALDVEIWEDRDIRKPLRYVVEEKMEKADALLHEILSVVKAWDLKSPQWSAEERQLATDIKNRLEAKGKRWWVGNPPWKDI